MPLPTKNFRVRVCATEDGMYTTLGQCTQADFNPGTEGGGITRWFGGEAWHPGNLTLGGSLNIVFERDDAGGQELCRTSWKNGTALWFQFCPAGTGAGAEVDQFSAYVTAVPYSSSRSDLWITGSITLDGLPETLTVETLA